MYGWIGSVKQNITLEDKVSGTKEPKYSVFLFALGCIQYQIHFVENLNFSAPVFLSSYHAVTRAVSQR